MIQPYFDPTVSFQGGSIFSQYLQGFVKERSAMNRQIMELALAQADPTFLQKQIQLMNENIIALEKAKAKAQIGDAKAKQDLLRITSPFARISYQYEKDIGVVEKEMGGKALTTLNAKDAAVKVAMTEKTPEDREKAITKLLADESDPVARTALLIAIEEQVDATGAPDVDKGKLSGYSAPGMKRPVFLSQYGGSTGITPYTTRVSEMLDFVEGKIGADTPANEAAFNSQIDAAIKKYEDQRAMYEKQLTDLQEGGVDAFAGFSRNYMLDNPFIQMSRSQGKVDALASAIEATQQEDFRTPFARVERVAATPQSTLSGNVYDADDEGLAEAYANYMQKLEDAKFKQPSIMEGGDSPFDMEGNVKGIEPSPKLDIKVADEEVEPFLSDDNVTAQQLDYDSRAFVPTVEDLSSSQVPSATPPPKPVEIGPPLTSPVRESNIFDTAPLQLLIDQGQIQMGLSGDGQERVYTPHTREAVKALIQQTRRTAGPGQVAFEVFPR